jgi:hypothetical protein
MANYIKSEVLAEAYTHLDIDVYHDKAKLAELEKSLSTFFQERASFLFDTDVQIKIEFEEGSLKTKIIAFGSAATVLAGVISNYGTFRQSVTQLAEDASGLAQSANLEMIFRTKTPYCDRLRIEKRKGVFGRVASLITELDAVSAKVLDTKAPLNHARLIATNDAIEYLINWDTSVDKLFAKFDTPETAACVAEGLISELARFPKKFPWQDDFKNGSFKNQILSSNAKLNGDVAASIARYEATLKLAKNKMKQRATIQVAGNS